MSYIVIILLIAVAIAAAYFVYNALFDADYRERWKSEAPPEWADMYDDFFTSTPPGPVFDNMLKTAWTLNSALQNQGFNLAGVDFGYRDPVVNTRVGGAVRSKHMSGEAIDFWTDRKLSPGEMANLGLYLNSQGLRVIFYPFGPSRGGRAIHVQPGTYVYYEKKVNKKSYATSYSEAENS